MPVTIQLNDIQIATPCRADWSKMMPCDEKGAVRHCQSCNKNVYNLSLMNREEALALIQQHEGEMCVRLARRADGTVITGDCPVGQQIKQRRRRNWAVAAIVAALIPSPVSAMLKRASAATLRAIPAVSSLENTPAGEKVFGWLEPQDPTAGIAMGAIAISPLPQQSQNPAPTPLPGSGLPDVGQ